MLDDTTPILPRCQKGIGFGETFLAKALFFMTLNIQYDHTDETDVKITQLYHLNLVS